MPIHRYSSEPTGLMHQNGCPPFRRVCSCPQACLKVIHPWGQWHRTCPPSCDPVSLHLPGHWKSVDEVPQDHPFLEGESAFLPAVAGVTTTQFGTFAVILGFVLLHERPKPNQWIGIVCTIAGVSLLAAIV